MPHNIPLIGMVGNLYVHFHQSRMSQHTIADAQAAQCLKIDPCEKDHFKPKGVIWVNRLSWQDSEMLCETKPMGDKVETKSRKTSESAANRCIQDPLHHPQHNGCLHFLDLLH